jgi:hypothetical protein
LLSNEIDLFIKTKKITPTSLEILPPIFRNNMFISKHFTTSSKIPSNPTVLQLGSFHCLSSVEPWDLTADLKSHPLTLSAQSQQFP